MIGSSTIAAWLAHVAFWVLLVWGLAIEELATRGVAIFLVLWLGGLIGLPRLPFGDALFSSYVAVLDVALVLIVVKGDIKLT